MTTYALFFLSVLLAAHQKIAAAMSSEWAARLVHGLYWAFPKTAELGRATVALVAGRGTFRGVADMNFASVYGSTAVFALASLSLACWIFSRKDF
jgi:ABC-type transport system involved in multi-copper enzyme maturation permease subunit